MYVFLFLQVTATDRDCGANAQVTYKIAANLGFQSPDEFEVRSSGDICVTSRLDYETRKTYDFPVVASDQGKHLRMLMVFSTLYKVSTSLIPASNFHIKKTRVNRSALLI